jgi:hypothetical protein
VTLVEPSADTYGIEVQIRMRPLHDRSRAMQYAQFGLITLFAALVILRGPLTEH